MTALRLFQDWGERDAEHALALRSTFSIGLPVLGATINDTGTQPSGQFVSWLGQAQYVRRVYRDWDLVLRSNLQLADRPLFPIEQFALGGIDTVRGYREYLTVTDDALSGTAELRLPFAEIGKAAALAARHGGRVPAPCNSCRSMITGAAGMSTAPPPIRRTSQASAPGSAGPLGAGVLLELYYGKALRHVDVGTSLQDRGIHFRLTVAAF